MKQILPASALKRLGRYGEKQTSCTLNWSMSGVALRAACTEMAVEITCDYEEQCPWIAVLTDAAPIARFPLKRGTHWYTALAGMDGQQTRDIAIVRDTQPVPGDARTMITIENVSLEGEVQPNGEPALVIEFVGDSLTSGEGTVGAREENEWRMAFMSASHTYAQMLCAALKAEGRWVSLSGWGVHCSWDGQEDCRIPRIYDQVCGAVPAEDEACDFSSRPADLIVINLGTNDGTPMKTLKGKERSAYRQTFAKDVQAFLRQVRRHNPAAYVLWAYGMCGRPLEKEIRQAVEAMRAGGDDRVDYVRLPACRADETGSRQHPGPASHRRAARAIAAHCQASGWLERDEM